MSEFKYPLSPVLNQGPSTSGRHAASVTVGSLQYPDMCFGERTQISPESVGTWWLPCFDVDDPSCFSKPQYSPFPEIGHLLQIDFGGKKASLTKFPRGVNGCHGNSTGLGASVAGPQASKIWQKRSKRHDRDFSKRRNILSPLLLFELCLVLYN